uniref:Uncharacterized protein n=1 Tax=Chelonoidis abingdonii TaxID=106734 RepID=A0A8C0GUS2_CHEAB
MGQLSPFSSGHISTGTNLQSSWHSQGLRGPSRLRTVLSLLEVCSLQDMAEAQGGESACTASSIAGDHSRPCDGIIAVATQFFLFPFQCQSLFRHHLENDLVKRITGRKASRRVFGTISANKFNRFGTLCSPFHALATPEMQKLTLPQDLPMTPRMLRQGIFCSTETDLRSLPLTFPDLDTEKTEEPSLSERKKSSLHMKTPLLPPLVKPTRASLSHSKKAKSFQFLSQFPQ